MMRNPFDAISEWTVTFINFFYRLLVFNTYFILSNLLFLAVLVVIRLNLNNFIFFIVPLYGLVVSVAAQFKLIQMKAESVKLKQYWQLYRQLLQSNWATYLFYTGFIVFIVFDIQIMLVAGLTWLLVPVAITGIFLLSSMFFMLLITTDPRARQLSFKRKVIWSVMISYRLPLVTVVNMLYGVAAVFCLQNFSLAYLAFIGCALNYFVYVNLCRRFSVALFFEQMAQPVQGSVAE